MLRNSREIAGNLDYAFCEILTKLVYPLQLQVYISLMEADYRYLNSENRVTSPLSTGLSN